MSFVYTIRRSLSLIEEYPEEWLAHTPGKYINIFPGYIKKSKIKKGLLWSILSIFKIIFNNFRLIRKCQHDGDLLVLSHTSNQVRAIKEVVYSLKKEGVKVDHCCLDYNAFSYLNNNNIKYTKITFSTIDIMCFVILLIAKGPSLYSRLLCSDSSKLKLDNYYLFIQANLFVPYFIGLINSSNYKGVILTNDHTAICRSLLFSAKSEKILTFYIQHAAVSDFFPPIEFDCALLDGRNSYEAYIKIQNKNKKRKVYNFKSLLIGMQNSRKMYAQKGIKTKKNVSIGIALKGDHENLDNIFRLINNLTTEKHKVFIRTHPKTKREYLELLKRRVSSTKGHVVIGEVDQTIEAFLYSIDCLIAGDSSIILESCIFGLPVFYSSQFSDFYNDYYGFSKSGLVKDIDSLLKNIRIKEILENLDFYKSDSGVLSYYNSSSGTRWIGKEALVASKIITSSIYNNSGFIDKNFSLFSGYKDVYIYKRG